MVDQLVRPPTLTETVANTLRDTIFRGALAQGEPLRESELSNAFGVSRGTVREALRILHEDKLVDIFPHRGAFVTKLDARKVCEIYSLRELLEPYAVGLALANDAYGDRELQDIEAVLHRIGEGERAEDHFEQTKADVEFHYVICQPSDHHMLLDVLTNLQQLTTLCVTHLAALDPEEPPQEQLHGEIFDAIRAGDATLAQDLIREHLRAARDPLIEAVSAAEAVPE